MSNLKKLVLQPLYKLNLLRKTIRSFFTSPRLSSTLYGKLYFNHPERTWKNTAWMGVPIWKLPLDMWVYQEILFEQKPDVIIETGTAYGGSALYLAHLCDLLGRGRIVTVDIKDYPGRPRHERIEYVIGSSVDQSVIEKIRSRIKPGEKTLVILDSLHRKNHVVRELELYGELVSPGSYMILEDTYLNGYPVYPSFGPGPMEALKEYLPKHPEFETDKSREKFFVTWNPRGYLKKIR